MTLSVWLAAARRGEGTPDSVVRRTLADAPSSVVVTPGGPTTPLLGAIGEWSRRGAGTIGLALPAPGDPAGLAGPAAFNSAALEAGEAVLVDDLGLVPHVDARTLVWEAQDAERPAPADPDEAGRSLRQSLLDTTSQLVRLDVASWQPDIPDLLLNLSHRRGHHLPRHWSARRVETFERAQLCLEIIDLALADDGGAVSAHEMEQRRACLRDLDRFARRALVATCSDSLDLP